jgi:phosphoserine phosphatase RsbU/P
VPATSHPSESRGGRIVRVISIYLLAPLLMLMAVPAAIHIVQKPDLGFALRNLTVAVVYAGGPAERAGVRKGDVVIAVDGVHLRSSVDFYRERAFDYSLAPVSLTVARAGVEIPLVIAPRPTPRPRLIFDLSLWVGGLAFLMIGWWVFAKRHDAVARNFFGMCVIFAFYLLNVPPGRQDFVMRVLDVLRDTLQLLWPVFFLRFIQLFPATETPSPLNRRQRLVYAPAVVLMVLLLVVRLLGLDEKSPVVTALAFAAFVYFVVYCVAGLVVFARKVLRRDRPVQHTKLRVILLGLVCGMVPFLIALAINSVGVDLPLANYLGFAILLVPASFALAIMRYGALDTAFVVRTSLIYGLLTLAILAAYFLAVGLFGQNLAKVFDIASEPVAAVAIAACSLLVLPLRRRLQRLVDHAFYPSRRADRQALADLARALADQMDAEAAHALLLGRLHDLYRPRNLALLLGEGDAPLALRPARALVDGVPTPLTSELRTSSPVAHLLDRLRRPVFREEVEDALPATVPDPDGRALLVASNAALLVPLISGNQLLGVLILGPKPDGSLYRQTDLANLSALALQAASLLRSLSLVNESLLRRQLETELAVARDIQAHLLPTIALSTSRFRVAGCMSPCRQVGGDYFDYFPLGDDSLGVCIADVSGKGIPAALLMTTVRVAFRAEALPDRAPEAVVMALNLHLREVLSEAQFVSFFYGVFNPRLNQLAYCNAGMDPPLLFHRDGRREVLRKGGPVLGVVPDHPYRRGTVTLAGGDLLLAYTDGITDQTEPTTGEFFDLERLELLARRGQDLPPDELCDRIFAAVEAFGGTEASDDKTVMVLKIDD